MSNKTLYLHPNVRSYRKEIFELLSDQCNVDFYFTGLPREKSHISHEVSEIQKDLKAHYTQCKEFKIPIKNLSWEVLSLIFSRKYDTFIFSGCLYFPFILLALPLKLRGKKVLIFDELWRYPHEVPKFKLFYLFIKFLVKYTTSGIITAGSKAREFYMSEFKLPSTKISIAYNTTIDNSSSRNYHKKTFKINHKDDNQIKLLYLGRVVEYKGLDVLLRSMNKAKSSFILYVVGDGYYLDHCKKLARELEIEQKVHFIGACNSDQASHYYKSVDGFVLPTKFTLSKSVQTESWGFTINEAMSHGLPVLSTSAVGSAYDLISEGATGYIAKGGSVSDLAINLDKFIHAIARGQFDKGTIKNHLNSICNYQQNLSAYQLHF